MPRTRGAQKLSACEGKRQYTSEQEARTIATRFGATVGARLRPYRCLCCRGWHIGRDYQ